MACDQRSSARGAGISGGKCVGGKSVGVFTAAMTVPTKEMFMGGYMRFWRVGKIMEASMIGIVLFAAGCGGGNSCTAMRIGRRGSRFARSRLRGRLLFTGWRRVCCRTAAARARLPEHVHEARHTTLARAGNFAVAARLIANARVDGIRDQAKVSTAAGNHFHSVSSPSRAARFRVFTR